MFRRTFRRTAAMLAIGVLLAGCSLNGPITNAVNDAASPPAESGSSAPAPPTGALKVGIASREVVNDYNRDIVAGAEKVFIAAGASVTTTNAGGDNTQHINNIQNLINSGVNILLIQLGDPASLGPVVKSAKDRGITVVTAGIGSTIPGAVTDVGGDETLMAEMMSRALLSAIGYHGDLYAFWVPGAPLLETRLRVLEAMVADYPAVTLHKQPSDFSPAKVQSQMQAVLTANPEPGSVAGVWGAYDQMTSGAVQAIQQADRPEIKVAAIDGDRATFSMMYAPNSPFVATVVQDAGKIGEFAAKAAIDSRSGAKTVPTSIFTTAWVATRNNGIKAAEERYGPGIWKQINLDPDKIRATWPQDQDVVVMRPVTPQTNNAGTGK